jgi:DNA (cytosine-5)-methyltransferase 1
MLTIGSLFSGIGGLELGLCWAGLGPVLWQVERDPFCRSVLARHWPGVDRYADVREVVGAAVLVPDCLVGGFPCQDVSSAGNRAGLAGRRSGLWSQFARLAGELRPAWIVVENVASGAGLWVDQVCSDLEGLGYASLPVPLSARGVGLPHRRSRIFIVSHALCERQPAGRNGRQAEPPGRTKLGGLCGALAYPDGGGCERERESEPARVEGAPGNEPDRRGAWRASEPERTVTTPAQPDLGGVAHGVPDRLDRLRALGNSVVPQCAEVIGHLIKELSRHADQTGNAG